MRTRTEHLFSYGNTHWEKRFVNYSTPGRPFHLPVNAWGHTLNEESSMPSKNTHGIALATAAAVLFSTALLGSVINADEAKIHYAGVNAKGVAT